MKQRLLSSGSENIEKKLAEELFWKLWNRDSVAILWSFLKQRVKLAVQNHVFFLI